jgi:tripartite-type tricarboxylate transporter receptor subunit TctC
MESPVNRRSFVSRLICLAALLPAAVAAQEWPSRPVRLVVPALAGSSADAAARAIAEKLATKWKQPVVVDNKPGGGTVIATESVAKAPTRWDGSSRHTPSTRRCSRSFPSTR